MRLNITKSELIDIAYIVSTYFDDYILDNEVSEELKDRIEALEHKLTKYVNDMRG